MMLQMILMIVGDGNAMVAIMMMTIGGGYDDDD